MKQSETLSSCPVCSATKFQSFISCEDYTVSHETFQIANCQSCGFKFTNPRPSATEIGRYYQSEQYISHSNTSKGIINALYQFARKFTIAQKIKLISLAGEGRTLLDYGCGTGEFLAAAKKSGWQTKGIEPSPDARSFAITNHLLEVFSPDEINTFPKASFNVITLWHVLEHIHLLNETIAQFKNLLAEKGKLIVAVPNSDSSDARVYKETWAAYDVPRHLYHFTATSITKLFANHGMKVIQTKPMALDAFYVSLLSEKYKCNSFGLIRGIWNGVKTNTFSLLNKQNASSLIFILEKK